MNAKKQALVSILLVGVAAATVFLVTRSGSAESEAAGSDGHDHAAMLASQEGEARSVRLDPESARRIGVTFATAERRSLDFTVRGLGTVAYDETRLATVNPKVEGWVERLHVNFTGAPVRRGQPLMELYSPNLVSAQEEFALASRLVKEARGEAAATNARELLEASRRRLDYWDVPAAEISRLEETGQVRKTLTLAAPASGIVMEKNVVEGDRVTPGMTVFRIADLSTVWIEADVYEKDLALVREGQTVTVTFESYPGRELGGRITYVYPTVSMQSRTGRIRLELPNPELALKPGMYARIELTVSGDGPSVVVPRSAVLSTGERSLVFVREPDGTLVPRNVVPGRTEGRTIEILTGLSEGERVVSSAAFLVDAESSLGALTGGEAMDGSEHGDMDMDEGDAMDGAADGSEHDDMDMDEGPAGDDPDAAGHVHDEPGES